MARGEKKPAPTETIEKKKRTKAPVPAKPRRARAKAPTADKIATADTFLGMVKEAQVVIDTAPIEVAPLAEAEPDAGATEDAEAKAAGRILDFEPFTLVGTAEVPIFLVTARNIREVLPDGARFDGWVKRLQIAFQRGGYNNEDVYSFSEPTLRRFLKSINKIVKTRHGTDIQHVEIVELSARPRMPADLVAKLVEWDWPQYQIEDQCGYGAGFAIIAATTLAPFVRKKVIITPNAHFNDRGGFQIHIGNRRGEPNRNNSGGINMLLGIKDAVEAWGEHTFIWGADESGANAEFIPIRDDEANIGVAELYKNGLFINVALRNNYFGMRIFNRILEEALRYLADPAEFDRMKQDRQKRHLEAQKTHLVNCTKIALEYMERSGRGETHRAIATRDRLRNDIKKEETVLMDLHQQLFAVENTNAEKTTTRITGEFERLVNGHIKNVSRVYFDQQGHLHIVTEPIVAHFKHDNSYYLLGTVDIIAQMPTRGRDRNYHRDGYIRLMHVPETGRERKVLPHTSGDGTVCWGNIAYEIYALLANFEFEALATLAITFLQRGVRYDSIRAFPKVAKPADLPATTD